MTKRSPILCSAPFTYHPANTNLNRGCYGLYELRVLILIQDTLNKWISTSLQGSGDPLSFPSPRHFTREAPCGGLTLEALGDVVNGQLESIHLDILVGYMHKAAPEDQLSSLCMPVFCHEKIAGISAYYMNFVPSTEQI